MNEYKHLFDDPQDWFPFTEYHVSKKSLMNGEFWRQLQKDLCQHEKAKWKLFYPDWNYNDHYDYTDERKCWGRLDPITDGHLVINDIRTNEDFIRYVNKCNSVEMLYTYPIQPTFLNIPPGPRESDEDIVFNIPPRASQHLFIAVRPPL